MTKRKIPCGEISKCTGCMACYNKCPFNAISICIDKEGFEVPNIDVSLCKKCNQCNEVCPVLRKQESENLNIAYAAYSLDSDIRYKSSSGGIFSIIAEYVLDNNGVVVGAIFDADNTVKHYICKTKEQLDLLRGAKYVQSSIGYTYKRIKHYLDKDVLVYFCGTPCQAAGLKSFLNKEYENLICSDFICHGVPSPKVWKKYLSDTVDSSIEKINFRDKRDGWRKYSLVINTQGKEVIFNRENNEYMKGYLENLFLRKSCYSCQFKGENRYSDITLADCWGIENIDREFDSNDEGTSLLLINSKKGQDLIKLLEERMTIKKIDKKQILSFNKSANESPYRPIQRERFLRTIDSEKYGVTMLKTFHLNLFERLIIKIRK